MGGNVDDLEDETSGVGLEDDPDEEWDCDGCPSPEPAETCGDLILVLIICDKAPKSSVCCYDLAIPQTFNESTSSSASKMSDSVCPDSESRDILVCELTP